MKDVQFIEKIKYFLFLQNNWSLTFSKHGNYLNKFWSFSGFVDVNMPEEIEIKASLIQARLGLYVYDENLTFDEARQKGYSRSHIPLNLFDSIDDLDNIPSSNIESGVFCYYDIDGGFKRYVFAFKNYYNKFPIYQEQDRLALEAKETLHYAFSYGSLFKYAVTIIIKDTSIQAFEDFLAMPYGDINTQNTWKYYFNQAVISAKNGDTSKIEKYDYSIISHEIEKSDRLHLLENFDSLNLSSDLIISLLTPPSYPEDKKDQASYEIYLYISHSSSFLLFKLWMYFVDLISNSPNNYFFQFNEKLLLLSQSVITADIIETIGVNEVEVYQNYTGEWNLFHKLGEQANVFAFCINKYQSHFGIMRFGAEYPPFEYPPFLVDNPNKIMFSYRAFEVYPPPSEYQQLFTHRIAPFISFDNFDALKIVKVYLVEKPEDISGYNSYEKFVRLFFSSPQDFPTEEEKEGLRFIYMPAICAYNLYLMNNFSLHREIRNHLISIAINSVALYVSYINVARYSVSWFLATGSGIVSLASLTINAPGIKQEILDKYGAEGQEFINAWEIIETATIALNLAYGGFYGAKSLVHFINNSNSIRNSANIFLTRYKQLSANLRRILKPLNDSVNKNILRTLDEFDDYALRLNPLLQEGKSIEWIYEFKQINGTFPPINQYIKPDKLIEYSNALQVEEVAFIISKREIVEVVQYQTLPPSKFAGFTGDMEKVVANYNTSGKNVKQLINDLKLNPDKLLIEDEIFLVKVKLNDVTVNINYDMPTGNELGVVAEYFKPGGILPTIDDLVNTGSKVYPREAVITNANLVVHNNNWNTFVDFFGSNNVIKISP